MILMLNDKKNFISYMLFIHLIFLIKNCKSTFYYENYLIDDTQQLSNTITSTLSEIINFNYYLTTSKNKIEFSYDLQANQLLNFLNLNPSINSTINPQQSSSSFKTTTTTSTTINTNNLNNKTNKSTFTIKPLSTTSRLNQINENLNLNSTTKLTKIIDSFKSEIYQTKSINNQLLNSILKQLNETKNSRQNLIECLNCTLIKDLNDCKKYQDYDEYINELISVFCCQCSISQDMKLKEKSYVENKFQNIFEQSKENGKFRFYMIIFIVILISVLVIILIVYVSIWIYRVCSSDFDQLNNEDSDSSNDDDDCDDNNDDQEISRKVKSQNDDLIESSKSSVNSSDSLDLVNQCESQEKKYFNIKSLNKNNNNNNNNVNVNVSSDLDNLSSSQLVNNEREILDNKISKFKRNCKLSKINVKMCSANFKTKTLK